MRTDLKWMCQDSDNEILYDKDGNIISEDGVGEGFREIMEYGVMDVFVALARTRLQEESQEDTTE